MTSTPLPIRKAMLAVAIISVLAIAYSAYQLLSTSQPGGAVVVLVGRSASSEARARTIDACAVQAARRAVARGASITIAPIGRFPVDVQTTPINTRLGFWVRLNPSQLAKENKALLNAVVARVRRVRASASPDGASDLVAATSIASTQLATTDGQRWLIVCDDAHQYGGNINLYRRDLSARIVRRLVREHTNEFADLASVTVAFAAIYTDTKSPVDEAHEKLIADFWKQWAIATHATAFTYTPTLPSNVP